MRERLLSPDCEAYLGPVAIAQFVACGWLREHPLSWSPGGRRAAARGFGVWSGTRQALPLPADPSPCGAAFWAGRKTRCVAPLGGRAP